MKKKTLRFLRYSIVIIFILCIVVFLGMASIMLKRNDEAMRKICQTYTSEVSYQLANHFGSIADLRFSMLEDMLEMKPPAIFDGYGEQLVEELTLCGKIWNYTYVALYAEDGEIDVIYGEPLKLYSETAFHDDILKKGRKVLTGGTESGDLLLLFGLSASYPMKSGKTSIALITGLPLDSLNYTMSLEEGKSLVYYHIIRVDGSYVIRNPKNHSDNYLDWMMEEPTYDGKTREQTVSELRAAISEHGEYSVLATVNGNRRNIYFVPLENSNWYLVTVLLYGTLDTVVSDLGNDHMLVAFISCGIILIAFAVIYIIYFRMSNTQLEKLEKETERANRANQAKREFLSNMSHDIRTPMNGIVGMTAIATANIDDKEAVRDALHKITLSGKHLLGLINDILDMSKIEMGKLSISVEQLSLRDFMESVVNIVRPQIKSKGQNFDIFIRDIQCEDIYSDSVRLNQILVNLLSNAVKYTPPGGSIYVTLSQENSPKGENYVRSHIWVKDTGIGMSEEFQKKIFDSFTREDNKRTQGVEGTGLGMAITKCIVDAMEGTIDVKSELDKGSEFHVVLDFERAQLPEGNMALPAWKLLLVDDDDQLCRDVAKNLELLGVHADWGQTFSDAMRMVEQEKYDIVMLDWQVPDMNGVEMAKQLRPKVGKDVPILLISAYDWSDIEKEARGAGIDGFICKPLFKSTLYHGLVQYAGKQAETVEPREDAKPDFTGKHLLVAEDYDMNWEICNALLSVYGFELEWAENGQICVEKFQASEPGFYNAILMDLRMPVMNGYEATKQIRASGRPDANLPIIAMTADAFSEDIQRCLDCGINTHVAKPIDMNKLLKILQEYLL